MLALLTLSVLENVEMLLVYNHALQTPTEKKKNNEKRETFSQSIDSPLFFDDELPKPSLVGSAVVGCDGSVTGTLFLRWSCPSIFVI